MYAEALEYPPEVFGEDVELEAELGIDSVKQTELLSRVAEKYRLPERPENFRLSDYRTVGQITDYVLSLSQPAPIIQPEAVAVSEAEPVHTRKSIAAELIRMYAAALEYPEEVFSEEVQLEAELGIDSVKQTELLARVSEQYHLPARPADFRLSDYDTMGKIIDFVYSAGAPRKPAGRSHEGVNGFAALIGTQTQPIAHGLPA
jgi:acyl carrier protein